MTTDTDEIERVALLPCPFCGSPAWMTPDDPKPVDGNYSAECTNEKCQATFLQCHNSQAEAIADWNTRAAIAAHDSELAKVEGDLDKAQKDSSQLVYNKDMRTILDLDDAWNVANHRKDTSNLARCYISLKAENARLREVLALAKSDLFDLVDPSGDIRFRPAIDRIDSALKGGTE